MTNISSMEVAEVRPFFLTALRHLQAIHPGEAGPAAPEGDDADDEIGVRRAAR